MRNYPIVKIRNLQRYGWGVKEYGYLVQQMQDTDVVRFGSNTCGLCINIAKEDVIHISQDNIFIYKGKLYLKTYDGEIDLYLDYWDI